MAGEDINGRIHQPAAEVVVVMVPYVAHGHLNQLLHLSHLISSYNIPVHFVNTTTNIRRLRSRFHHSRPCSAASNLIHFHELRPSPPLITSSPRKTSDQFHSHPQPAFDSTLHLRGPVADLMLSLSRTTRRVAIIHDFLMSYVVQDLKSIPNAESFIFHPLSAFDTFWRTWERMGRPIPVDQQMLNELPSEDGSFSPEFIKFVKLQERHINLHVGVLFDSSRLIEGEFLGYLERLYRKKKLWAIGPFNPVEKECVTVTKNRHKCLQWLDAQPPKSVLYVSFGTTTTFSDDQIKELAIGLERSQQRFIWAAQAADKGDMYGDEAKTTFELPNGFEERVKWRGMVLREWAPQMEILRHFATGGFMSHCGWNSSMESISMGVPMATWPMHSDQPRNAFLITNVLRIGLAVKDWARRDELVTSVMVEDIIRRLMGSREEEEMRKRAAKLGVAVRKSVGEGGVCRKEIDLFISYISRDGNVHLADYVRPKL